VGVFVDGQLKGEGVGPSKQAGQQKAAQAALVEYQPNTPSLKR
jgi:dsRNA-specific ribonuclease